MLNRVFAGLTTGFCADVGAADPLNLSVTKWFYDLGWSGLNIIRDKRASRIWQLAHLKRRARLRPGGR
jgi:hypothetical protein